MWPTVDFLASHFSPGNTSLNFLGKLPFLHFQDAWAWLIVIPFYLQEKPGLPTLTVTFHKLAVQILSGMGTQPNPAQWDLGQRFHLILSWFFFLPDHGYCWQRPWDLRGDPFWEWSQTIDWYFNRWRKWNQIFWGLCMNLKEIIFT